MNIKIRDYKDSDFDEICSWWKEHGECPPLPGMMCEKATFVLELDDQPVMTLTILTTESLEISYFEGYCVKPGISKSVSHELGDRFFNFGYALLKQLGFKRVVGFTNRHKLVERYQELGMDVYLKNMVSLGREL